MANILFFKNPFDKTDCTEISANSISDARRILCDGNDFALPTIAVVGTTPVLRKDWDSLLEKDTVVQLHSVPLGAEEAVWYIVAEVVIALAAVIYGNMMMRKMKMAGERGEPDPVYSIKGSSNQIRLGHPITVPFGANRWYPDYATAAYNEYRENRPVFVSMFRSWA